MTESATSEAVIETPVVEVELRGEKIEIGPLPMRHWPAFFRLTRQMGIDLNDESLDWEQAIAEHGEQGIELMAIMCDRTPEWVGDRLADEFIDLLTATMTVNFDFFVRRVMVKFAGVAPQLGLLTGRLSSRLSSLMDTTATPSSTTQ